MVNIYPLGNNISRLWERKNHLQKPHVSFQEGLLFFWSNYNIFHQPSFPWNKKVSLTKPQFGVRSCEVAIVWPYFWYMDGMGGCIFTQKKIQRGCGPINSPVIAMDKRSSSGTIYRLRSDPWKKLVPCHGTQNYQENTNKKTSPTINKTNRISFNQGYLYIH